MNQVFLTHFLSGIAEAAIILDEEGRICFVNETAEHGLGYDRNAVIGKFCWEVVDGLGERGGHFCVKDCEIMQLCRRTHKIPPFDLFVLRADHTRQWMNTSTMIVPCDEAGHFFLVHVWRDVGQRKEMEFLMEEIMKKLSPLRNLDPAWSASPPSKAKPYPLLTEQEKVVLRLLNRGCDTLTIARELNITPVTVRNHIQHLMKRLGVHSRLEAIQTAARLGIL